MVSLECFRYILQFGLCNACKDLSQVVLICWMQYAIFLIASKLLFHPFWITMVFLFCVNRDELNN
jgi:hypothetical protein